MLKSKLQFAMLFLTFGLLIATLVLANQEATTYIPEEDLRYKSASWDFWPSK